MLSSLALPFDNTRELLPVGLGASCGEGTLSSAHLDTGEGIGDGVLPVRSTMDCICRQNTLILRWRSASAYSGRRTVVLCLLWLRRLMQPSEHDTRVLKNGHTSVMAVGPSR